MQINIYKDKLLDAHLFGATILYSAYPIPREDVPAGWYCYDLRGTARHPDEPYALVDQAEDCHAGSVLSELPLKSGRSQKRLVKDTFRLSGTSSTLAEFCAAEHIPCPETPIRHMLRPASPEEAGLFYAQTPEKDEELGAIGHVRSCFDKQAQQMGLTERGRQKLKDAVDPALSHSYEWYVIENINDSAKRIDHILPLDEAIPLYAGLNCEDKRLGVTKDEIAAVDLVICWDGREWLSEDRLKLDSFKDDPVVADAYVRLQKMLEATPVIGRVSFASGETEDFTDPEKYLQTVCEELPYQATTGFRCETLTDDPAVRKAVDDMLCDLYGEENPRQIEDYSQGEMTMEMGGHM